MNDNDLIRLLESIRELEPRAEMLSSVKKRVFESIEKNGAPMQVVSPIRSPRLLSPLSGSMFAALGVAFAIVLVVANQLPMYNAYQNSIASIATTEQLADTLDQSKTLASTALDVKAATEKTRATLDTLKLKGIPGVYSSTQCQNAYALYDSYLYSLGDYLDKKIPTIEDPATLAALRDLRAYVLDSRQEAQARIHMYSQQG